jgi:AcrR family transcriptional regulator
LNYTDRSGNVKGMPAQQAIGRGSARERLLAAADELFYAEGVHTVGIDRVVEQAGVAKASLYAIFGSKEGLVHAYLLARDERIRGRMNRELAARFDTPRERLLGVFEVQGLAFTEPGFRGCAFSSANAETPRGGSVEEVTVDHRVWIRTLFRDLGKEAGARDPEGLARQLALLYDGAGISAWMDRDPDAARAAQAIARCLVDASIPGDRKPMAGRSRSSKRPRSER